MVLLHGWMAGTACWQSVMPHLRGCSLSAPSLPGHGRAGDAVQTRDGFADPEALARTLADAVPDESIWIGWSLGGLIAQQVAVLHPHKVSHLVCVCASPRFIAADDWPHGMPRDAFNDFVRKFNADPQTGQREFIALQAIGDGNAARLRKSLRTCAAGLDDVPELRAGLAMLVATDVRDAMSRCERPVSFIAGENDRLAAAAALEASSRLVPAGKYHCIAASAHAPMLAAPAEFARALEQCLRA